MSQSSTTTGWNLCRFIKTLSFFGAIPFLSDQAWFQTLLGHPAHPTITPPQIDMTNRQIILDFTHADQPIAHLWGALDDVVMGGVSESTVEQIEGAAVFSGRVSTANSGGFASVRTRNFEPPLDLSGRMGIELRVKGDGQRYKFFVRTETRWDGVAHCYSFDTTPGEWITVQMPFDHFVPVFRAKTVPDAPLNLSRVYSFQLMLSKFEYNGALNPHFSPGRFTLCLQSIAAYGD